MFVRVVFPLILPCFISAAVAQIGPPADQNGPTIGEISSPADEAYMKAVQKMQDAILASDMSGNAATDYVRIAIVHNQGALDLADVLLREKGVDPALKQMVQRSKIERQKENEKLQSWLKRQRE